MNKVKNKIRKSKKIKKGDEVVVISGKNRGKKGLVIGVNSHDSRILVEGVNTVKKHVKANPQTGEKGGIVIKLMPIDRSNVMLLDPVSGRGTRVGIMIMDSGKRARYYKSSNELVDV